MDILVTFNNTHAAIALEKAVKDQGIKGRLIGTPERVSAACGLSLKAKRDLLEDIKGLIHQNNLVDETQIYEIIEKEHVVSYQMLE